MHPLGRSKVSRVEAVRFVVTHSTIVDDVLRSCSAAGDNDVLGRVLLRRQNRGAHRRPSLCMFARNDPRTLGDLMGTRRSLPRCPLSQSLPSWILSATSVWSAPSCWSVRPTSLRSLPMFVKR